MLLLVGLAAWCGGVGIAGTLLRRGVMKAYGRIIAVLWLVFGVVGCDDVNQHQRQKTRGQQQQKSRGRQPSASKDAVVRVMVINDTKSIPIANKSEIWFRGHGSWWLKRATEFGSDAKKLGRRNIGSKDTLVVYPDGRNGKEFSVPFMMTAEMNPEGSVRDSILIEILDTRVKASGLPIKAATGKSELIFQR